MFFQCDSTAFVQAVSGCCRESKQDMECCLDMLEILLLSGVAGIVGTGLGGAVGMIFAKKSESVVSCLLSFAAGVMLSIVFFDLIPESVEISGVWVAMLSVVLGAVVVALLSRAIDRLTNQRDVHVTPTELHHQEQLVSQQDQRSYLKSGLVMFAAIALHNLPEGMVIGSGGAHNTAMGVTLAILIAIHNIPEGISIGVPLMEGGMKKWRAVALTALSGAPTFVGGAVGALLGSAGETFVAVSLACAGGAMLYVTFCEILPQALLLDRSRRPAAIAVAGVLFGLMMVAVLT